MLYTPNISMVISHKFYDVKFLFLFFFFFIDLEVQVQFRFMYILHNGEVWAFIITIPRTAYIVPIG